MTIPIPSEGLFHDMIVSTRLGGRREIGTFSIKWSVRQRLTEEFANKEERRSFSLRTQEQTGAQV